MALGILLFLSGGFIPDCAQKLLLAVFRGPYGMMRIESRLANVLLVILLLLYPLHWAFYSLET